MEDEFDEIANGKMKWVAAIDEFYKPFEKKLAEKSKEIKKEDFVKNEELGEKCPECGSNLIARLGRFGRFVACSGFPKCKYSRPLETKEDQKSSEVVESDGTVKSLDEAEGEICDKCGGKMVLKEGRFGKFLACENYPKCKNTKAIVGKTGIKCPQCEKGELIERKTKKRRSFWGCSRYPECNYATWENPTVSKE
jgi:DNA topoisomerase-1